MIKKFDLISGTVEEVGEYIESLPLFTKWQVGNDFSVQVDRLLKRPDQFKHIGPITYMQDTEEGVVIHAAFVAITKNWQLHGNSQSTTDL